MSTINVKVVKLELAPHINAERLEVATVGGAGGFTAVVGKGEFQTGDLAIFVPPDSVVPANIQEFLATKKKITVKEGRIRCTRVRGTFSDGLCLVPKDWLPENLVSEDKDVTEFLGITKYEPPPPRTNALKSKGINHHYQNENFKKYTDIENFKKYPKTFNEGEEVVATIKYHGSNWRACIVKRPASSFTWVEKVKSFFGFKVDSSEYLVGSHNTIRKQAKKATTVEDVFCKVANNYNVKALLDGLKEDLADKDADVSIYGEVIGPGIQTGYTYGVPEGQHELRIFDIMVNGQYLNWDEVVEYCEEFNLPLVEVVYRGPWSLDITKFSEAVDEYNGQKHTREGIVIKPIKERKDLHNSRAILKYVSETFRLDKKNSEHH